MVTISVHLRFSDEDSSRGMSRLEIICDVVWVSLARYLKLLRGGGQAAADAEKTRNADQNIIVTVNDVEGIFARASRCRKYIHNGKGKETIPGQTRERQLERTLTCQNAFPKKAISCIPVKYWACWQQRIVITYRAVLGCLDDDLRCGPSPTATYCMSQRLITSSSTLVPFLQMDSFLTTKSHCPTKC